MAPPRLLSGKARQDRLMLEAEVLGLLVPLRDDLRNAGPRWAMGAIETKSRREAFRLAGGFRRQLVAELRAELEADRDHLVRIYGGPKKAPRRESLLSKRDARIQDLERSVASLPPIVSPRKPENAV